MKSFLLVLFFCLNSMAKPELATGDLVSLSNGFFGQILLIDSNDIEVFYTNPSVVVKHKKSDVTNIFNRNHKFEVGDLVLYQDKFAQIVSVSPDIFEIRFSLLAKSYETELAHKNQVMIIPSEQDQISVGAAVINSFGWRGIVAAIYLDNTADVFYNRFTIKRWEVAKLTNVSEPVKTGCNILF